MKIGDLSLNLYSFGYSSGFIEDTKNKFKKISLEELVEKSKKLHLGGIEFPFDRFFTLENLHEGIEFLNELDKKNVNFYLDLEHFDIHYMEKIIPTLSKIGISSARIKMDQYGKTIYGGNRYLSGSFQEAKEDFIEKLSSISHCLKEYSFTLAIENHQDLSSTELVQIIESLDTYYLGINWDIGNSISCLDTPESFYKNTKHLIKNVHLKDYQVFDSEKGIRLVRCPIGEGYVDFSEYLKLIYNNQSIKSYSIELGAQITRECNIKNEQYWNAFKSLPVEKTIFIEYIDSISIKNGKSLTRFEEGCRGEDLVQSENNEVFASAKNLSRLLRKI